MSTYTLGQKEILHKFRRVQIRQSMISDHNGIETEISDKVIWKIPKYLETKQYTSK